VGRGNRAAEGVDQLRHDGEGRVVIGSEVRPASGFFIYSGSLKSWTFERFALSPVRMTIAKLALSERPTLVVVVAGSMVARARQPRTVHRAE
jgi:hypothetical protein